MRILGFSHRLGSPTHGAYLMATLIRGKISSIRHFISVLTQSLAKVPEEFKSMLIINCSKVKTYKSICLINHS